MVHTAWQNMDPMWIYHFIESINNTILADNIAKQVTDAPKTSQEAFEKAFMLEAGLKFAEDIAIHGHDSCSHEIHDGCVHHVK